MNSIFQPPLGSVRFENHTVRNTHHANYDFDVALNYIRTHTRYVYVFRSAEINRYDSYAFSFSYSVLAYLRKPIMNGFRDDEMFRVVFSSEDA